MKIMKQFLLLLVLIGVQHAAAQEEPYYMDLEEVELSSFEGIHSGVGIKWKEYWLFIGGRTNGLHGFRPPLAFPSRNVHDKIVLIDFANNQRWEQAMTDWPDALREPLSSSNMQYAVKDDQLLICGGYGWQKSFDDFTTFPSLSLVNIPKLIEKLKAKENTESLFTQITDKAFAVCGGNMAFMGDTCVLAFGHEFVGHYSRHNNGFFSQEYTNEVRRFVLDKSNEPAIKWLSAIRDTANFHRRDYNLVAQMEGEKLYYTAYSGVFQYGVNLPFYHPVELHTDQKVELPEFQQKYSHYHSAVLPVYNKNGAEMHTYFFGGMAEYYVDSPSGNEVHDTLVPFVKTVSRVSKGVDGYTEAVLANRMPAFMGSNMWFFPSSEVGFYNGKVLNADYIKGRTLVGYLVGGITSPYENINLVDPSISVANKRVFKIYLSDIPMLTDLKESANINLNVHPNPSSGQFFLSLDPGAGKEFAFEILDLQGRVLKTWVGTGAKTLIWAPGALRKGTYIARATVEGSVTEKKLIWE